MIIKDVSLAIVCGITSRIPATGKPEVAFAGKSNVGKSSLINALLNRRSLARTGASPGKTQTVNFYQVNRRIYLVDLPGYGYARASEEIRAKWGKLVEDYLYQSKEIRAVFLLLDIRRDPSENDRIMYRWICDHGREPVIVATKLDKVKRSQAAQRIRAIRQGLEAPDDLRIIPFSAETKQGRDEIWELIDQVCETQDA